MKILIVHHRLPYPLTSGIDKIIFNLIKFLNKKHDVTIVTPINNVTKASDIHEVEKVCSRLIPVKIALKTEYFRKNKLWKFWRLFLLLFFNKSRIELDGFYPIISMKIREITSEIKFDIIQATSLVTSNYLIKLDNKDIFKLLGPVDDMITAAKMNLDYSVSFKEKLFWLLEYKALIKYQVKACKESDLVFFLAEKDLENIQKLSNNKVNSRILRVAVESDSQLGLDNQKERKDIDKNSVIFVGGLGPKFNRDAVLFFYNQILPIIRTKIPDVKFYIVGNNPPQSIKKLEKVNSIIVTGRVPDVKPHIKRSAVYVAPIISGTGLKTKIVEALMLGKAIVATTNGISGIWNTGDGTIKIRDNPVEFANEVIKLLSYDSYRFETEKSSRQLFNDVYQIEKIEPFVYQEYERVYNMIVKNNT